MPRAVLNKGIIYPIEPLPADWRDGTELILEKLPVESDKGSTAQSVDEWMNDVDALAAQGIPEDDKKLAEAIALIRQQAKDLARQGKRGWPATFLTPITSRKQFAA